MKADSATQILLLLLITNSTSRQKMHLGTEVHQQTYTNLYPTLAWPEVLADA